MAIISHTENIIKNEAEKKWGKKHKKSHFSTLKCQMSAGISALAIYWLTTNTIKYHKKQAQRNIRSRSKVKDIT